LDEKLDQYALELKLPEVPQPSDSSWITGLLTEIARLNAELQNQGSIVELSKEIAKLKELS
jgi:hypothetical protein